MDQGELNRRLWRAARAGRTEEVEYCIKAGADVSYKDWLGGRSVLHAGSLGGNPETVSRLLSMGADINARDDDGRTPYDVAWKNDVKQLLKVDIFVS